MSDSPTLQQISRTLKEISYHLKEQNRILGALSNNYVEVNRRSTDIVEPAPEASEPEKTPRIYGWSMAASVQRDGDLEIGDMKTEQDESIWIWTGEIWERVEAPSADS